MKWRRWLCGVYGLKATADLPRQPCTQPDAYDISSLNIRENGKLILLKICPWSPIPSNRPSFCVISF
jgi:hypothetical protein